ncbi:MAG: hypothetical protein ACOCZ2_05360 [Thermodesulfobacteriota bacterium]
MPLPSGFGLQTQKQMQSVSHWKEVAKGMVEKVDTRLQEKISLRNKDIYVAPAGKTPFEKAFRKLLLSGLVQKGLNVVNESQGENLLLSFQVDTVKHHYGIQDNGAEFYMILEPGMWVDESSDHTGSGTVMAEHGRYVEMSKYAFDLPQREIMLTLSLRYKSEFIARYSSVFYINDKVWWHYKKREEKNGNSVKTYQMVSE